MSTTTQHPETDPALIIPIWATCRLHGRRGHHSYDHDVRGECEQCRWERQSVTHYGLSNAIDAPLTRSETDRGLTKVVCVGMVCFFVLVISFWSIVHQANRHLDAAVARIERASR